MIYWWFLTDKLQMMDFKCLLNPDSWNMTVVDLWMMISDSQQMLGVADILSIKLLTDNF